MSTIGLTSGKLNLLAIKIDLGLEEKTKNKPKKTQTKTPKYYPKLFLCRLPSWTQTPPNPAQVAQGGWAWLVSVHSMSLLLLLPSHTVILLQHGLSMGCTVNICSSFWCTSSSYSNLAAISHSFCYLLLSLWEVFCPFLNSPSQGCHHPGRWAQLCPGVGWLEPVGTICVWHGATPASADRGLCIPCCQCPAMCIKYSSHW